jgi:hypothetical protein
VTPKWEFSTLSPKSRESPSKIRTEGLPQSSRPGPANEHSLSIAQIAGFGPGRWTNTTSACEDGAESGEGFFTMDM